MKKSFFAAWSEGKIRLLFYYFTDDGLLKEYVQEITGEDLNIIPPALKEAMTEALKTQKHAILTKNSLESFKSKKTK